MANYKLKTSKAAERAVVGAYHTIEHGVVDTYRKIEDGVVGTYRKIEDRFVATFLEKTDDEDPAETKH